MIPRFKPDLGWAELKAALSLPEPNDIEKFEEAFAKLMGQKYALVFPYGRTGLLLLIEALGLKDKEIICPAYTCVVVAHAIIYSGNIPVFVDCEKDCFNMDLDLAMSMITEKTGVIIATSIFGYPVNLDKLDIIRSKFPNIKIIQDCAHSFAASWNGRFVQHEGDAAIFGLNISKIITSIFGGMVTTDSSELYDSLKKIRNQRLIKPNLFKSIKRFLYLIGVYIGFSSPIYSLVYHLEKSGRLDKLSKYYDEDKVDMPSDYLLQMSRLEARVGLVQLSKYHKIIRKRREMASFWRTMLIREKDVILPLHIDGCTYSHFTIQVDNTKKWIQDFLEKEIQLGRVIDYSVPYLSVYNKGRNQEYPISLKYTQSVLNLPLSCKRNRVS